MAKLHEQVSAVSAIDDAIDGSRRAASRRQRATSAKASPLEWLGFCRRCGFRDDDPQVLHRHMAIEIKELESELRQLEADYVAAADLITAVEAAQMVGVSSVTIRNWGKRGKLETVSRRGRDWFVSRGEIESVSSWRKQAKHLTNEQKDFLRAHQGDMTTKELGEHLGRSAKQVVAAIRGYRLREGEGVWPRRTL